MEAGAFCLAVAAVEEGAVLRSGGIDAPVLLFSQPLFEEIPEILENRLTPLVSDADFAGALNRQALAAGVTVAVHLKIDTGMGRMGCAPSDAPALARRIAGCAALRYEGTMTHLAVSDSAEPAEMAYTRQQIDLFRGALDGIRDSGLDPGIVHAANSGAVLFHPDAWFDMVRPGILLYGYHPSGGSGKNGAADSLGFRPVMELVTTVVFVRKVKQGESVSYGRTWTAQNDTTVAVLPIGYADGLPRLASDRWQAHIRDGMYPLVGRICMDQCLADLGPEPEAQRWDEVTIFGGQAPGADVLAARVGTIPYEITCNINKRVPRVYVRD